MKEDVPVGIQVAITPTEFLLSVLLVFLMGWMIVFAYLALRRAPEPVAEARISPVVPQQKSTPAMNKAVPTQLPKVRSMEAIHAELSAKEAVLEQSVR
ncbi:hypothetical protein KDA_11720 [Dictyobacter alpinus]|uniref:Uncharacterized protein n=1 Tax=Dictyobacter alpinus TaxID=2014873 RepID=A0A402B2X6_9CHLR|nr:hypothetical protein KDA_11720 [Dictyobacter alpinus]